MKLPVIVNESNRMDGVGDVSAFKTVSALETQLEPWYVEEPHFIFDGDGMQLEIAANGHNVQLRPKEPPAVNPEVARSYFAAFLQNYDEVPADFVRTATLAQLAEASEKFAEGDYKPRWPLVSGAMDLVLRGLAVLAFMLLMAWMASGG